MIAENSEQADTFAIADSRASRKDLIRSKLVEIGIVMQDLQDTRLAADYLNASGIELEVAVRVLAKPLKRRKSA